MAAVEEALRPLVAAPAMPVHDAEPAAFTPGEEPAQLADAAPSQSQDGAPSAQVIAVEDFRPVRLRHADIQNDLQFGPSALVVERLVVRADVLPESLRASLIYRLTTDESATRHHFLGLGVESPSCEGDCALRWFAQAGYAPDAGGAFSTARQRNRLYWTAIQAAAGVSVVHAPFAVGADAQLEYLDVDYRQGSTRYAMVADTLSQVRVRAVIETEPGPRIRRRGGLFVPHLLEHALVQRAHRLALGQPEVGPVPHRPRCRR